MKKTILISSIAIAVISSSIFLMSFKSSPQEGSLLFVRIFESTNSSYRSSITISDGVTIIKSIDLEVMKPRKEEANTLKIAQALNNIKDQGYTLVSSNGGGSLFTVTNYVFEKK